MIVVKVELWSAITGKITPLACMVICNDGKGTRTRGNYDVRVLRRGAPFPDAVTKTQRTGRVENYPRQSYSVWQLVRRALEAAGFGATRPAGDETLADLEVTTADEREPRS